MTLGSLNVLRVPILHIILNDLRRNLVILLTVKLTRMTAAECALLKDTNILPFPNEVELIWFEIRVVVMSMSRAALGRPAPLGSLYDVRTDTIVVSSDTAVNSWQFCNIMLKWMI